jgi:hypothetical protein
MTRSTLRPAAACFLSLVCWLVPSPLAAQGVEHPLDPLSFREMVRPIVSWPTGS